MYWMKFLAYVENQISKKLMSLRSDNGGEYVSKVFKDSCDTKGIKRELTAPFNPSQNGVAERLNRTIQEKVRCMLSHAALPHGFWAEVVSTAVHLINRSPSKILGGRVLEEVWSGKPPSYAHLRVFGCEAYVHIRSELRTKLDPKSCKCIFLGYGEDGEMGYRLWEPAKRKVGKENVVQVITDNASNCASMGRKLEAKFPSIVWTPCASHCIDLLLEDIGDLPWVKDTLSQALSIVTFINVKIEVLAIFRTYSDLELKKPSATRFAAMWLLLERLYDVQNKLQKTVVSDEFKEWLEGETTTSQQEAKAIQRLCLKE
ncbi:hypothetical protein L7F22_045013 [Adiantum nelumboides]|nr:hypothetical protein [Adiantum nelumboides]